MIRKETVRKILDIYKNAWINQDSKKILTIFTKKAIYHERAFEKPFVGHAQIKKYWQEKVVKEQSKIQFKLLHTWIDGKTVIAEWDARFFSKKEKKWIHIKEVAIFTINSNKIDSFREYWHSEKR